MAIDQVNCKHKFIVIEWEKYTTTEKATKLMCVKCGEKRDV